MDTALHELKKQLQQLAELHQAGALSDEHYAHSKTALERKLLDRVLNSDLGAPAPAPAATAGTPAAAPSAAPAPVLASAAAPAGIIQPAAQPSVRTWRAKRPGGVALQTWAGIAVFTVVLATGGYLSTRTPEPDAAAQEAATHNAQGEQISAMLERLQQRLQDNPKDVNGWAMLARSYTVLQRPDEALRAYEQALKVNADDPGLLVDYADALAMKNNRTLAGEPMKLVQKALKKDPRNIKGLALAGTDAFDRKDYKAAAKLWGQVVSLGGPDNPFAQQIEPGLAQARELAGLPPLPARAGAAAAPDLAALAQGSAPGAPATGEASAPAASGASVSGRVTLAASLAGKASPTDTVFITARPQTGSRMPLAVLRRQVKDLPLDFKLDDSLAMSPAARISGAGTVIVTARVSKSGNAMSQPGDLSGQSAPVRVGTQGLALEIRDPVQP